MTDGSRPGSERHRSILWIGIISMPPHPIPSSRTHPTPPNPSPTRCNPPHHPPPSFPFTPRHTPLNRIRSDPVPSDRIASHPIPLHPSRPIQAHGEVPCKSMGARRPEAVSPIATKTHNMSRRGVQEWQEVGGERWRGELEGWDGREG